MSDAEIAAALGPALWVLAIGTGLAAPLMGYGLWLASGACRRLQERHRLEREELDRRLADIKARIARVTMEGRR